MTTVTQRVKKLFFTNPMKMEISRFRSRFLRTTGTPAVNTALICLAGVVYVCILGTLLIARRDLDAGGVVIAQVLILMLTAPLVGHSLIAGEKDRRSWDLLQVAPVTQSQIVFGKFMGVLAAMLAISVAFIPAILIGLAFGPSVNLYNLMLAEGVLISSVTAISAYSLYLSARLRSANAALAVSIASIVGVLVVAPLMLSVLIQGPNSSGMADWLFIWHPVYAMARILFSNGNYDNFYRNMAPFFGWPQIVGYSAFAVTMVLATIRRLEARAGKE